MNLLVKLKTDFFAKFSQLDAPVLLAVFAIGIGFINTFLCVFLLFFSIWLHTAKDEKTIEKEWWILIPILISCVTFSYGYSLPEDDLLRHLAAWKTNYDYSGQYPLSNIPKENFWLGYDYILGTLQANLGIKAITLLYAVPILFFFFGAFVLIAAFKKIAPDAPVWLFLMFSALCIWIITPRMLLGRPEALMSLVAACAWLVSSRKGVAFWVISIVSFIPVYYLGWIYSPFALLLPLSFRSKIILIISIIIGYYIYWDNYLGSYFEMLIWLKGTMWQVMPENKPVTEIIFSLSGGTLFILATWTCFKLYEKNIQALKSELKFDRSTLHKAIGSKSMMVALLSLWFILPNQIRYFPSLVLAASPWIYSNLNAILKSYEIKMPVFLVISMLIYSGMHQTPFNASSFAEFSLEAGSRVWSEESPYSAVFFAKGPIQVEPSMAFGATLPQWRGIQSELKLGKCDLLQKAKFDFVIEKTLPAKPNCLELIDVQGVWRLWQVKK